MITNKKILVFLVPLLCVGALVGCGSNDIKDNNNTQQEQVVRIKYNAEFKKNFMEVANKYNDIDEFKAQFKEVKWNDTKNEPVLPENIVVTKLSKNEIVVENRHIMNDKELELVELMLEMQELLPKVTKVQEENEDEYEDTKEWKQYEALLEKQEKLIQELYGTSEDKEETEKETTSKEKSDNTTVIMKALLYGVMGGGEEACEQLSENFGMLGMISSYLGLTKNEYIDYMLENNCKLEQEIVDLSLIYK